MLDVGQYFMEEEMIRQHAGGVDIPGAVRDHLYRELYGVKYPYYTPVGRQSNRADGLDDLDEPLDAEVVPFDPKAGATPVKAYTPPTDFDPDDHDPFGGVLDAPIG